MRIPSQHNCGEWYSATTQYYIYSADKIYISMAETKKTITAYGSLSQIEAAIKELSLEREQLKTERLARYYESFDEDLKTQSAEEKALSQRISKLHTARSSRLQRAKKHAKKAVEISHALEKLREEKVKKTASDTDDDPRGHTPRKHSSDDEKASESPRADTPPRNRSSDASSSGDEAPPPPKVKSKKVSKEESADSSSSSSSSSEKSESKSEKKKNKSSSRGKPRGRPRGRGKK